jgi:hypothetical protein
MPNSEGTEGITRWACWHPDLGYLRFSSYAAASSSEHPDPRGCFTREKDADMRRKRTFFHQRQLYQGSSIKVRKIMWFWEVR